VYVFIKCDKGGEGIGGLRQINSCRQVLLLVNFWSMVLFNGSYVEYSSEEYKDIEGYKTGIVKAKILHLSIVADPVLF
jgi:hypothetical protein